MSLGAGAVAAEQDPRPPVEKPAPAPAPKPKPDVEPEPAPQRVLVEGQVTDHAGRGNQDVAVIASTEGEDGKTGKTIAETVTDEFGDFKLTVDEPLTAGLVITFDKPSFATLIREIQVDADAEYPPFLAEILEGSLILIGRVVEAIDKRPVADADVTLKSIEKEWEARTDEQGEFTIKGVFPGPGELVVTADGYGREQHPVGRMEEFGEIVVVLKPERVLHLRLRSKTGGPVAKATIECFDQPRDDFRTVVSDTEGTVTLRGIHFDVDTLAMRITHPDYVSDLEFDREIILPEKETESTHMLLLMPAGRVTGTVTDANTDAPLHGARVMTGAGDDVRSPRDWVGYLGRYTVNGVAPGEAVVTVHMAGYAPELAIVEIIPAEAVELNFKLRPGAVLTGTVRDENDAPVGGAEVVCTRWRDYETIGLRAMTDAAGRFTIESAPYDAFEITVIATGREPVTQSVVVGGGPVQINLGPATLASGTRANATIKVGDPVPNLTLMTLDGEKLALAEMPGQVIVIDFWATWCGPCVATLPEVIKMHEKYAAREDFVMISISMDEKERELRRFIEKKGMGWHQVFGLKGRAKMAHARFGVSGIPTFFVVGRDGKIAASDVTSVRAGEVLEELFKKDAPE